MSSLDRIPIASVAQPAVRIATLLLFAAFVVGVLVRFQGLGERQLSTIEFYLITSVRSILESGLPGLPGGGYYHPGLTAQYVVAGSAFLFGDDGMAYRLPGVVFSLGTVSLAYVFARPRVGHILASSVCAALLLSSWEIEFARLVRPYAMFQFVTVLFLVSMDYSWWRGGGKLRYLPHACIGLAALTSEFPPVLLPLLLLPYLAPDTFLSGKRDKIRYGTVTAAVALTVSLFNRADFRTLGVSSPLPVGVAPEMRDWFQLPLFPFWSLNDSQGLTFALMIVVGAAVVGAFYILQKRQAPPSSKDLVGLLLVVAAVFHSFLLAAGMAALLIVRYRVWVGLLEQGRALLAIALSGVLGLAWLARATLWDDWIAMTSHELGYESLAGALRITFFGWPDIYGSLIAPWRNAMPMLGLVLVTTCAVELLCVARGSRREIAKNPAVLLVIVATAMGILSSEDRSLGSSFYLYPLMLVVVACVLSRFTLVLESRLRDRWSSLIHVLAAVILLGLFASSEDFSTKHLLNIRSQEVSLRTGSFQSYAAVWSARDDILSPASFVASAVEDRADDVVIVQGLPAVSQYLSTAHAVYFARDDMRFPRVSREGGTIDVWSKQRLLSTDADLSATCEAASTLWVVRRSGDDRGFCRGVWASVQDTIVDVGADGRIEVVRLDRFEIQGR